MEKFFTEFFKAPDMNTVLDTLTVMWQGMRGIFVVMVVISLVVWGFGKIKFKD